MSSTSRLIRLTFLGGSLGTAARFTLSITLGDVPSIILVNLLGAALLGWFNGNPRNDTPDFNTFWKVGFTGGFTTMSAFASFSVLYMQVLGIWAALATVAISALGLAAYALAFNASKKKARA